MVWACILGAVAIVAVLGSIIAVYDVERAVADRAEDEVRRLWLNAERSAGQIESQLQEDSQGRIQEDKTAELEVVQDAIWLRRYWTRNLTLQPGRITRG